MKGSWENWDIGLWVWVWGKLELGKIGKVGDGGKLHEGGLMGTGGTNTSHMV